jgi:hypothetical protein
MMDEDEILGGPPVTGEDEPDTVDTSRIRANIAQTREQIGSTIEALQEKLSPAALADQAKTAVRDATIGKVENMVEDAENAIARTGHSFFDTVRDNPVPAAMIGVGLAWLLVRRRRHERQEHGYQFQGRRGPVTRMLDRAEDKVSDVAQDAGEYVRDAEGRVVEAARTVSDKASEAARTVSDKASEAAHNAGDMVRRAEHRVAGAARSATDTVKRVASDATETGRRIEDRLEQAFYDNPLALGAAALATGTVIGLAIPISHKEDEWMGAARDELVGKASDLAHQAIGKVEDIAREATGGPTSQSKSNGEMPRMEAHHS